MTTEQECAAFKSWYANSHNSGTPWDAWKARAALAETAPCLFKALQKIASLPEYRMDEASLIATEALYEVERAAQGLPPHNPRKPTEEEWRRLTENGRRAWGKQPAEPTNKHSLLVAEPEKEPPCET